MHCINLFFISLLIAQFENLRRWFRANSKTKQIKKNKKQFFLKHFKKCSIQGPIICNLINLKGTVVAPLNVFL